MPCHTTGFDPAGGGAYPAGMANGTITVTDGYSPIDDGMTSGVGTWEAFGVQCENCHAINKGTGQGGMMDHAGGPGDADSNGDDITGLDETYWKFRTRTEGATDSDSDGDKCDSGDRVIAYVYTDDFKGYGDDGTFYSDSGGEIGDLGDLGIEPCQDYPSPRGGYHDNRTVPEHTEEVNVLCGECHGQVHHTSGFYNSPHSAYEGPAYDLAEYADSNNYDDGNHFYHDGSCIGCHDVHETTQFGGEGGEKAQCGIQCHNPSAPWGPSGGYTGFHDGFGGNAPDTTSTEDNCDVVKAATAEDECGECEDSDGDLIESRGNPVYDNSADCATALESWDSGYWNTAGTTGNNPDACQTCHMPHGAHFFDNSEVENADYDPVAEGLGFLSHGHLYGIPAAGVISNSVDETCGQCHFDGGVAIQHYTAEELSVFAANYHSSVAGQPQSGIESAANARFNWYQGAACYQINLDGSDNDGDCSWDFPGGTPATSSDCVTSTIFDSAGSKLITLTTDTGTRTMAVTAKAVNALPTTAMSVGVISPDGMTLEVTDASSATGCAGVTIATSMVIWGDGTTTLAATSTGPFSHTYGNEGTYTISYSTRDSAGNKSFSAPQTWTVPDLATSVCAVEGNLAGVLVNYGTMITLKEGMTVVQVGQTDTNGDYSLPNVTAGHTYDIIPSRNGYTFSDTVGGNATITLSSLDCTGTQNNTGNDFDAIATW